ncbi:nucleotide-binding alpha-beta plait domain-containing protein [Tanacetum coccineum]
MRFTKERCGTEENVMTTATTTPPRSDLISSLSPTIRSNQRSDPHIHSSSPRCCRRRLPSSETPHPQKRKNITMAMILAFIIVDKTAHNSHKFAFTLSPTNYGYWKTMIEPFRITNNLIGYVDGLILCPSKTLSITDDATVLKENHNYPIWVSNDAHVRMIIIFTISEASFRHVQGKTSRDLWLSLEKAYAPHSTCKEYTLKTKLLRIEIHGDGTPNAYLNRAQEYADALAAISEPIKDKDLVMLAVPGLHEEYNC